MAVKAFVDTNVLLRFAVKQMDGHEQAASLIKHMLKQEAQLWINGQVIREFIVQAKHPKTLEIPLTTEQVLQAVKAVKTVCRSADETEDVRVKLLELIEKYPTGGKQIHDANLVATMLVHGIGTLLTFNVDDFKRFSALITIISTTESP